MTDKIQESFSRTREAGAIAAATLDEVANIIKPGISTSEIDKLCFNYISDHKGYSAPLYYRGFPSSCCTSPNHVVCHGIPKNKILNEGDIVNVDVTVFKSPINEIGPAKITFLSWQNVKISSSCSRRLK